MKARVKATGEIIDVYCDFKGLKHDFLDEKGNGYMSDELTIFDNEDYEQGWNDGYYEATSTNHNPDYWEKLKHQYAGMAMQGILTNPIGFENIRSRGRNIQVETALLASEFAHALVEKYKKEE